MAPNTFLFRGLLLGAAVGDALGLPLEGLAPQRAHRLFPGRPRHRLLFGRGMISDDTEHTLFVAQSLIAHPLSPERFQRRLAWCLRGWFFALPAGVGLATARACLRLWIGIRPAHSGVFSAGNGPAMRAAPIGSCLARRPDLMEAYLTASTRLTHTDPRALVGARAVAALAAWCRRTRAPQRPTVVEFYDCLRAAGPTDTAWQDCVQAMREAQEHNREVEAFAAALGQARGVSGYMYHTVPVAAYSWYRHWGDFEATLTAILRCGGDTDTVGAIAGALAGAVVGETGIPRDWVAGVADWPRSVALLRRVADRLAATAESEQTEKPVPYCWPGLIPRNVLFWAVVLGHGFRRLAPPYG